MSDDPMSDDPMSASEETDDAIVGVSDSDASEKTSSSFSGGDDDDGDDDDGSVSEDFLDEPHGAPSRDHETVCEACGEGDDEPWGYGDGRDSYRSPRRPSGEAGSDESREAARLRRAVGGMGGWFRNIAKQAEEDGDEE